MEFGARATGILCTRVVEMIARTTLRHVCKSAAGLVVLVTLGANGPAHAADVDIGRQALVLARALAYDRNLPDRAGPSVGVGILYVSGSGDDESKAVHAAFSALSAVKIGGLPVEVTLIPWKSADALTGSIDTSGVDALYVCSDLTEKLDDIKGVSQAKSVLTIAGERKYVEAGLSMGVFDKAGEPKLAVNLPASKAEGASFSAELLRLADVIR